MKFRKPPNNSYATFVPSFTNGNGGNFWDGRAEGNQYDGPKAGVTKHIGDEVYYTSDGFLISDIVTVIGANNFVGDYDVYFGPTADQALNPMPNIVEQNIERQAVCQHVAAAKYAELYQIVWGVPIDCSDSEVVHSNPDVDSLPERAFDISFKRLMLTVCSYQASDQVNSFSWVGGGFRVIRGLIRNLLLVLTMDSGSSPE